MNKVMFSKLFYLKLIFISKFVSIFKKYAKKLKINRYHPIYIDVWYNSSTNTY